MLKHIRLATEEEINEVREHSDLMPGHTQVLAYEGTTAVLRNPIEANPINWSKDINDIKKARFVYSLEERFLGAGVDRYYVQIDAKDERWQKVVESWGFEKASPIPEFRYLRVIR